MKLLMTGGSGRLGRALRPFFPQARMPTRAELEITCPQQVREVLAAERPDTVLHAAAYTDVARAETDRAACWQVNVEGTRNVAQAARDLGLRLVFVSTDYVFQGEGGGGYREDDPPGLPSTYYGLTKLVAEEAARQANALILRTSFRERPFPHPRAATDAYTSQDYLDVLAPELALAVAHAAELNGVLHIASQRRSVYDLARLSRPEVEPVQRRDIAVPIPQDVSLDSRRWQALSHGWRRP